MATTRRSGYSGAGGGALDALANWTSNNNKNKFDMNKDENDRRFQVAKMRASDSMARDRQESQNAFNRDQSQNKSTEAYNRMFQQMVFKKMAEDRKNQEADPNEMAAFTTGKFTPAMTQGLGEMSLEDQIAVISEMAKKKGFSKSGEREQSEGGFFGLGAKKRKVPVYSKNQFSRE